MAEQGNKLSLPPSHIRYYMDSSSLFLSAVGSKLSMTFNGHSVQHCDRVAANQISLSSLANRSAAPCLQCPLNTPLVSFQLYLEAIFAAWTKLSCEQDTLDQAGPAWWTSRAGLFSAKSGASYVTCGAECLVVCVCVYKLCVRAHEPPATTISSAKVTMAVRRQLQAGLPQKLSDREMLLKIIFRKIPFNS